MRLVKTGNTGTVLAQHDVSEFVSSIVVTVEALAGTHPQLSLTVTIQTGYGVGGHGGCIAIIMKIDGEAVSVELVQSVVGGYPDIAVTVLADVINETAGELVGGMVLVLVIIYI